MPIKTIKLTLSALLLATTSCAAMAGNMYVVGSYGYSMFQLDRGALDSRRVVIATNGYTSSLDENSTAVQLKLGYQFTPNIAVEAGYADIGKSRYKASYTGGSVDVTAKATGLTFAALGIVPINDKFSAFAKLGMIDAKADVSVTAPAGATSLRSDSTTKWRPVYGIGGIYNASKEIGVRLELEQFNKLGDANSANFDVNVLSAGVSYKF